MTKYLLTPQQASPKLAHSKHAGYLSAVQYLAPASTSGRNVCAHSTEACRMYCLHYQGRGGINVEGETTNKIHLARIERTVSMRMDPEQFKRRLHAELDKLQAEAERQVKRAAARLNGMSDLPWTAEILAHPEIQFWDYTKSSKRVLAHLARPIAPNYHLTYSRSEKSTDERVRQVLDAGGNVAIVYRGKYEDAERVIGQRFNAPCVNGDESDYRFLDPPGSIALLRAKGTARHDTSGFVIHV